MLMYFLIRQPSGVVANSVNCCIYGRNYISHSVLLINSKTLCCVKLVRKSYKNKFKESLGVDKG
jgi:hypothetical protein